jgi:predicted HicB family RNase H-like nuclease
MAKTSAISVRVTDETKKAAETAAQEDGRSVAAYVERLLTEHLNAKGYMPQAKP